MEIIGVFFTEYFCYKTLIPSPCAVLKSIGEKNPCLVTISHSPPPFFSLSTCRGEVLCIISQCYFKYFASIRSILQGKSCSYRCKLNMRNSSSVTHRAAILASYLLPVREVYTLQQSSENDLHFFP